MIYTKILAYSSMFVLAAALTWCGTQEASAPEPVYDDLTVTSGDVVGIDTLIWGTRYATDESKSSFTFKGDQSFFVNVGENQVFGKRIVSEEKILLWEQERELEILWANEIQIESIVYKREWE